MDGSIFGMGMGGAVGTSGGGVRGGSVVSRPFTAKEWKRRKKRRKMAQESRRRNRKAG